jgi:kumamolisin
MKSPLSESLKEINMSTNSKKTSLKGTEHNMLPGARAIGPTDPHQLIEISVVLKHRTALPKTDEMQGMMSHIEFARNYGADPAQIDKVRKFAQDNNLQMLERGDEVLRRTVTLSGTAAAVEKAFGVELNEFECESGTYRSYTGSIQIPEELASFVSGVFGLDDRPVANPHFRYRNTNRTFGSRVSAVSYNPAQVAKLYGFPQDASGSGQTIGLIELGGGYRPSDIGEYFQSQNIKAPSVKSVSVDHATNRPSTAQSADGEVMLDIEVSASVAPEVSVVVYFAPNTSRGFQDALSIAIHDQLNKPSVLAICWGSAESTWTAQAMQNFDQVAQEAAMLGITITVASGDNGSSDGVNDGKNHVDFPASSPHVLATGGTSLKVANGNIERESAWNDGAQGGATGGGFSSVFARPTWQSIAGSQTGRGVPDVSCNADPETGYNILVDGQQQVVGGTSAAAPLWAGLVVLLNRKLNRRLGFVNPLFYSLNQSKDFRDITEGNNGSFTASSGWDPVTGLGTPNGSQLLQALQGAGVPANARRSETSHAVKAH